MAPAWGIAPAPGAIFRALAENPRAPESFNPSRRVARTERLRRPDLPPGPVNFGRNPHCLQLPFLPTMTRFQIMSEEIFDVVNERDEVIGQAPRREVHARGLWHRAVHILVFNAKGETFLQKRSMLKDTHPGTWDSASSGHVDAGEDYDPCALREVREEIGLHLTHPPRRLFKVDACAETGWEFCWVYRCESEGPFVLQPEEIETGAWFSPAAVTQWVNEKPGDFASGFVLIWKKFTS